MLCNIAHGLHDQAEYMSGIDKSSMLSALCGSCPRYRTRNSSWTMKTTLIPLVALSWTSFVAAQTIPNSVLNVDPPQPQATICGDIVAAANNFSDPYDWFLASDVIACLTSVPFNTAVADRFIDYFNQTLQFQSTTAFLRSPPAGYQQPASDTFALLRQIKAQVDSSYYRNQYAFDADIQSLIKGTHDSHVGLYAGALSQFTFAVFVSPTSVV